MVGRRVAHKASTRYLFGLLGWLTGRHAESNRKPGVETRFRRPACLLRSLCGPLWAR